MQTLQVVRLFDGTFPNIPYYKNKDGEGPAWGNSLFEDNAEYGLGMRLGINSNRKLLKSALNKAITLDINAELKAGFNFALENWDSKEEDAKEMQKSKSNA